MFVNVLVNVKIKYSFYLRSGSFCISEVTQFLVCVL